MILPGFGVDLAVCLGTAVDQRRLDGVPTQARAVGVELQVVVGRIALGEFRVATSWGGGHEPTVDSTQVDGALGTFKIVHVGRAFVANGAAVSWNQVSALGADVEGGLRLGVVERQGIDQVGEQLALRLPRKVRPHDRVVHGLVAHVDLSGQGPFAHVQERGPHREVVAHHVIEPRAQQGLRLDVEQRVRLE